MGRVFFANVFVSVACAFAFVVELALHFDGSLPDPTLLLVPWYIAAGFLLLVTFISSCVSLTHSDGMCVCHYVGYVLLVGPALATALLANFKSVAGYEVTWMIVLTPLLVVLGLVVLIALALLLINPTGKKSTPPPQQQQQRNAAASGTAAAGAASSSTYSSIGNVQTSESAPLLGSGVGAAGGSAARGPVDVPLPKMPVLTGSVLHMATTLIESSLLNATVAGMTLRDLGREQFELFDPATDPVLLPVHPTSSVLLPQDAPRQRAQLLAQLEKAMASMHVVHRLDSALSAFDIVMAYRQGRATPTDVVARVISSIEESNKGPRPLCAFTAVHNQDVRRAAEQSTALLRAGRPRSVLEGVPVAVKEEMDVSGYATTVGTTLFPGARDSDSGLVQFLREMGAIVMGKTNMHELGLGVHGFNEHFGTPRNPHNPAYHTGGSSAGSAAAVAAGLVPMAVGVDGGGSIRIPAAFCGCVGLKPTYGRVSTVGEGGALGGLDWSVGYHGPIASTVLDAALMFAAMAGPDERDRTTLRQPPLTLERTLAVLQTPPQERNLRGLRVGYLKEWSAYGSESVFAVTQQVAELMRRVGAEVVDVSLEHLGELRLAHAMTIASEIRSVLSPLVPKGVLERLACDSRNLMATAHEVRGHEYFKAQRIRGYMIQQVRALLTKVDVLLLPSAGMLAPEIVESALPEAASNLGEAISIMTYSPLGNMTGFPAVAVPVGYADNHLPTSVQLLGRAWDEDLLLSIAAVIEGARNFARPAVYYGSRAL